MPVRVDATAAPVAAVAVVTASPASASAAVVGASGAELEADLKHEDTGCQRKLCGQCYGCGQPIIDK